MTPKIKCYRKECQNNNEEEEICELDIEEITVGESGCCIEARGRDDDERDKELRDFHG